MTNKQQRSPEMLARHRCVLRKVSFQLHWGGQSHSGWAHEMQIWSVHFDSVVHHHAVEPPSMRAAGHIARHGWWWLQYQEGGSGANRLVDVITQIEVRQCYYWCQSEKTHWKNTVNTLHAWAHQHNAFKPLCMFAHGILNRHQQAHKLQIHCRKHRKHGAKRQGFSFDL